MIRLDAKNFCLGKLFSLFSPLALPFRQSKATTVIHSRSRPTALAIGTSLIQAKWKIVYCWMR